MQNKTVKELLVTAKELNIKGRHSMKKAQLIEAIDRELAEQAQAEEQWETKAAEVALHTSQSEKPERVKKDYIECAKVGAIVAFKVGDGNKALSGKIEEIHQNQFVIATRNGIRFNVAKTNVIWVKTTSRWPKGVYLALKGEVGPDEYKRKKSG